MLTPSFELSQDGAYLTIVIKAPFAKISDTEIFIDGSDFKFYSKPYYLRLNLPGRIVENGQESAKYESDKGAFVIKVPKETEGEHFEGLDMLTKLLAPAGKTSAKQPLIEVLDSPEVEGAEGFTFDGCGNNEDDEDEFDWQLEQEPFVEELSVSGPKYGFANQRSDVFKRLQSELHDLIDLADADNVPMSERRSLRVASEQASFEEDHYLADLYDDEQIKAVLSFKPYWDRDYKRLKAGEKVEDIVELTEKEKEKMRKLPRKEYVLELPEQQRVFLSLVDIIYAYAYNHHTTDGENTVESGWTICKLSPTLSCLETFTSLRDVLVASYRRSLIYPLYRHWKLCNRVLRDTVRIFSLGRRCLLKCLLEIHSLLIESDPRYILNDLYITDYCVWIQSVSGRHLESLTRKLQQMTLEKSDVDLDLPTLEQAAELAVEESKSTNKIATRVENLKLGERSSTSAVDELSNQIEELTTALSTGDAAAGDATVTQGKNPVTTNSYVCNDDDASSSDDESDASSDNNSDSSIYFTETDESSETESSSDSDEEEEEEEEREDVEAKVDNIVDDVKQKQPLIEVLSSTDNSNAPTTGLTTADNVVPENEPVTN